MMRVGGFGEIVIRLCVPPRSSVNSSRTILMTVCDALRLPNTSSPTAFSLTFLMKSLVTAKLTSASRRARRISFSASLTSSSESFPLPRSFLNAAWNRSDRLSNGIRASFYNSISCKSCFALSRVCGSSRSRSRSTSSILWRTAS